MAEYGLLAGFGALVAFVESAGLAIEHGLTGLGATLQGLLKSVGL
jgi:hypothetical protein